MFTATLKDHNAAVQNWRRIERARQQPGEAASAAATEASAAEAPAIVPPVKREAPAKAAKSPTLLNASKASSGDVAVPRKKAKDAPPAPTPPAR